MRLVSCVALPFCFDKPGNSLSGHRQPMCSCFVMKPDVSDCDSFPLLFHYFRAMYLRCRCAFRFQLTRFDGRKLYYFSHRPVKMCDYYWTFCTEHCAMWHWSLSLWLPWQLHWWPLFARVWCACIVCPTCSSYTTAFENLYEISMTWDYTKLDWWLNSGTALFG